MANSFCRIQDRLNIPVEEAYRVLRTNIQFCSVENKIKTIAVAGCNPGDGKTATAVNLAISIARTGERTLLVDADMRKPAVIKQFEAGSTKGLSHLLSGQASLDDVVCDTNVENLFYISSGPKPPNPAELISSSRLMEFIDTVREHFDTVIFDTPPLRSVIDCALIASKVDGTIIVVKPKTMNGRNLLRMKDQLIKANAKILGVVLNRIPKGEYRSYYKYSYNYHRKRQKSKRSHFDNTKGGEMITT